MPQPAIRVENLSKRFQINTLRSNASLLDQLRSFGGRVMGEQPRAKIEGEDFIWALRNISFEVQPGEIVGIIGKNGSGKSTLLKLLSRIIHPTEGQIKVRGKVASLLEVGTGFHPELSGRENVYMNAAILGMSRDEIRRKFDEIVAFSEVGSFIDTPVKRYSSGMQTRLAFAVAAHLEPDILIIDEVLSVGDANFQEKSLGKMDQVANEGRTVLFVSHNMGAVSALCPKSMLLSKGVKIVEGQTTDVINHYMNMTTTLQGEMHWDALDKAPGNDQVRLRTIRLEQNNKPTPRIDIAQDFTIHVEYDVLQETKVIVEMQLLDRAGISVMASGNFSGANVGEDPLYNKVLSPNTYHAICTIPGEFLNYGTYHVKIVLTKSFGRHHVRMIDGPSFSVYDTGSMRSDFIGKWDGVVRPRLKWRSEASGKRVLEG